MPLDDLNQKLYNPNSQEIAQREHDKDQFDPQAVSQQENPFAHEEQWGRYQKEMDTKKKKKMLLIWGSVAFFVALVGGVYGYLDYKSKAFFEDRVEVAFQGPETADSTQPVRYRINYKNANRVALKSVEITLDYPENFHPTENTNLKILGPTSSRFVLEKDIKAGEEGSVELNGVFFAPKDFPVYMRATMLYTPSSKAKQYEIQNQYSVNIASSPVDIALVAPDEVSDGDQVEYVIDFKNMDSRAVKNVQLRLDFPSGFEFTSASPMPSEKDSVWYLGVLDAAQGGKIQIQGRQRGAKDETKTLKVSLGSVGEDGNFIVYAQKQKDMTIVLPMLSLTQQVQGLKDNNVDAGSTLVYEIKYQNNGNITLRDAIITAELKSAVLDLTRLKADGAAFDAAKGLITWQAANVPALNNIAPQATGTVTFSVPVKEKISVQNENDKNFTITSVAKIDSPDIPTPIGANKIIGSNALLLKLNSKVFVDVNGFYKDANITNLGPIPPKVGNATTYVLHLAVASISNDLEDAKIVSSLPAGIEWVGPIFPEGAKIAFNQRTKEITWDIGKIAAGTGALLPKQEVSFQVGIKPQINQVGQIFKLLNKAVFTGKDAFTGKDITIEKGEKDSQLREDKTIPENAYKIQG